MNINYTLIKESADKIKMPDDMRLRIYENAVSKCGNKRKKFAVRRSPAFVAAALILCVTLAVPALAATVDPVYQMLYRVSPEAAQFLKPVQKSKICGGIEMEVVSAYVRDDAAVIYITLRDLEGNRIDETTDLYDSYSIHTPFPSSGRCENIGYDSKTGKATFLITVEHWEDKKITGNKITFSFREFLSGKKKYEGVEIPVDLSEIKTAVNTRPVTVCGRQIDDKYSDSDLIKTEVLTPSAAYEEFPIEEIDMSGIGYIDGKLHVQAAFYNRPEYGDHGYFYLTDHSNNIVYCEYSLDYKSEKNKTTYTDYVFDIPQNKIGDYKLSGYFVSCRNKTKGNWSVTFPLEQNHD